MVIFYVSSASPPFLSTPSARRATLAAAGTDDHGRHFYPRPPRGGRPKAPTTRPPINNFYPRPPRGGRLASRRLRVHDKVISIHALREEGDSPAAASASMTRSFLSTPSARRATSQHVQGKAADINFYPRPPRGGRPAVSVTPAQFNVFLSTPSARRATAGNKADIDNIQFLSTPSARRATASCAMTAL